MFAVSYAREIDDDLTAAARWYVEQQADLGEDFLRDFQLAVSSLQVVGQACRHIVQDYRRIHFKKYPYTMYFTLQHGHAVIFLVIHTSRDPALVTRLLRDRR